MITYIFRKFDYVDDDIIIPKGTIFFRGIDKKPKNIIRNVPIYIASKDIAKQYGQVYNIRTLQPLKLLDIRKLRHLLQLMIITRKKTESVQKVIYYLTMAFGLCSYQTQIKLLKMFLNDIQGLANEDALSFFKTRIQNMESIDPSNILNPFEPEGVRVAETYIDGYVMLILKTLFGNIYDGIIAPRLISPFHMGNMSHEEIIIFDPINKLEVLNKHVEIEEKDISTLLLGCNSLYNIESETFNLQMYKKGGSDSHKIRYEDKNVFFNDKKRVRDALKLAKHFKTNIGFHEVSMKKINLQLNPHFFE